MRDSEPTPPRAKPLTLPHGTALAPRMTHTWNILAHDLGRPHSFVPPHADPSSRRRCFMVPRLSQNAIRLRSVRRGHSHCKPFRTTCGTRYGASIGAQCSISGVLSCCAHVLPSLDTRGVIMLSPGLVLSWLVSPMQRTMWYDTFIRLSAPNRATPTWCWLQMEWAISGQRPDNSRSSAIPRTCDGTRLRLPGSFGTKVSVAVGPWVIGMAESMN